ncbi:MAG: cytochrome c oxidase subunit II [Flavobacteriales bacterium]|nr:cytochrome c oxidase subunit II [Flavobacteriales bacterium]
MLNLLIILVLVLAVIAVFQLTRVYEFSRSLRNNREEEISHADNKLNAWLMLVWMVVFFIGTIILYIRYGNYLPPPASEHGVNVDKLMSFNIWIITIAFFLMNGALFYISYKFYYRKDRKANFHLHDNRLEMLWTMIPGVLMAIIIIYGLITWGKMTGPASADAVRIEVYSKQFDWTARYSGNDKVFGAANFNMITSDNVFGIISPERMQIMLDSIDGDIRETEAYIAKERNLLSEDKIEALEDQIYRWKRHKQRLMDLDEDQVNGISTWTAGDDDLLTKELHMPVGKEVELIFSSRDVIHSAYMPHFRAQMNTVPGVPTRFKMKPTITTKEMREELNDPEFNYILLCNKVCGAAHYNMQMKVVVETQEEYDTWLKAQKTFVPSEVPAEPAAETPAADTTAVPVDTLAVTH